MKRWGKDATDGRPLRDRCPMTLLRPDRPDQYDPDAAMLLSAAVQWRKHGTPWVAGGYSDQPARFLDAMAIISATLDGLDRKAAERRAAAAKKR